MGPQSQEIMGKGQVGHRRRPQNEEGHEDNEFVPLRICNGTFEGAGVRQWHLFLVFPWVES